MADLAESQHCYSARLLRPFARALATYPEVPTAVIESIDALGPDERIPIATTHELLAAAISMTGDEDLGLRAAEMIEQGDYGALEYAASTAHDSREALETIGRYMHLINDALTFSLEAQGERAVITLDSAVMLPRAAEAFEVAAFYAAFQRRAPEHLIGIDFEVCLMHPEPADTAAYRHFFGPLSTIRFAHAFCGCIFPKALLDRPLPSADPQLHRLILDHADQLLAELPRTESFTARVREQVAGSLAGGRAHSAHVAAALHVSQRTLARRLEQEGTSFKELTEQLRRSLALRYVGQTDLALSEVAFLLGFSQASAFHRAFKRWTGETPREHRTRHRG